MKNMEISKIGDKGLENLISPKTMLKLNNKNPQNLKNEVVHTKVELQCFSPLYTCCSYKKCSTISHSKI